MLEASQINSLTADQKAAYARQEEVFQSSGWKDIVAWAQAQVLMQSERMSSASSWDHHLVARGARAAFMSVVQLQDTTEAEYVGMAAQAAEHELTLDEIAHE